MNFTFSGNLPLKGAFILLLLIGVMLPSDGDHGIFSPKSCSFILAMGCFGLHVILNPVLNTFRQLLVVFVAINLMVLVAWTVVGIENGSAAFGQFKLFLITLSFASVGAYVMSQGVLTFQDMAKAAIYGNFLYSLVKISLAVMHALHIINVLKIMEILGIRFMSMEILGSVGRLQTSVDILTPFLLYFVLTSKVWKIDISNGFRRIYIPIAWLSIAFSFSRFLLFCAVIAHAMFWLTLKEKAIAGSFLKVLLVFSAIVMVTGPEKIYKVVEKRFFSIDNTRSDDIRGAQVDALMETFYTSPYIGKGVGGYSEKVIRDSKLKYSYEVQWVSFLMQFGVIGLFLVVLPLIYLFFLMLYPPLSLVKFSLIGMYGLWIIAGFTNPFLISLASGVVYALFFGAAFAANHVNYPEDAINKKIC